MTIDSVSFVRKRGKTSVEGVEEDGEVGVGLEELFDEGKVKDIFKHTDVVFYGIDNFDG